GGARTGIPAAMGGPTDVGWLTVVGRSIVRWPPVIAAQVIEPGWLFGERNLGAHLERGRAAAPEDALEADMPDHALGAHGAGLRWMAAVGKLSTDRGDPAGLIGIANRVAPARDRRRSRPMGGPPCEPRRSRCSRRCSWRPTSTRRRTRAQWSPVALTAEQVLEAACARGVPALAEAAAERRILRSSACAARRYPADAPMADQVRASNGRAISATSAPAGSSRPLPRSRPRGGAMRGSVA